MNNTVSFFSTSVEPSEAPSQGDGKYLAVMSDHTDV